MSKDIRSWFKPKTSAQPKKPVIEDDDDVIPESPDVQIKTKRKEPRKRIILDDSDDDIFTTKKRKPSPVKNGSSTKKNKVKTPNKPALKETSIIDMFSGPIKRTEPLVKKEKKKTETGIHSDEEFEKSLLDIDAVDDVETKVQTECTVDSDTEIPKTHSSKVNISKINGFKIDSTLNEPSTSHDHKEIPQKDTENENHDNGDSPKVVVLSKHHRDNHSDKKEKREKSCDSKKEREKSHDSKKDKEDQFRESHKEKKSHDKEKRSHDKEKKSHDKEKKSHDKEKQSDHHNDKKEPKTESRHSHKDHHNNHDDKKPRKGVTLDFKEKDRASKKSLKKELIVIEESPKKHEKVVENGSILQKDEKVMQSPNKKEPIVIEESPQKNEKVVENENVSKKDEKVVEKGQVPQKDEKVVKNGIMSKNEKKRDFSVFLEDSVVDLDETIDAESTPRNKKKKVDKSLNESALTDEERHERKMYSAGLYQKYLNRSGPKHLGAKEIPEGTPTCLLNCAFLLTGVLDSFEREELAAAIVKYGGSVKGSMSKKVTHVLAGDDAGPSKMAKAQEFGIPIIDENDFIQMIVDNSKAKDKKEIKSENKSKTKEIHKKDRKDQSKERDTQMRDSKEKSKEKVIHIKDSQEDLSKQRESQIKNERKDKERLEKSKSETHVKKLKAEPEKSKVVEIKEEKSKSCEVVSLLKQEASKESIKGLAGNGLLWVDKYKPQNVKQIIGQHGDASNVKKLINWLSKWYVNRKAKLPKPSPWAKGDDGGYYKAVLLSGPPGVGKTTTVSLVCKELGFDAVEFNASDTRNKNLIREQIGELLTTNSLAAYAKGATGKQAMTKKHVLVMDEVDGMAGNEDRGGMQELISLIKTTSVPIICMCNDRNSQKMRSLVNYCYDLRFSRPRVEQIKSAMLSICCKEGIKIPPDALTQLIIAANQDVRQTLNLLSMWAVDSDLTDSERLKEDARKVKKDIKLGPWEAVRKVFSEEDHKTMSIHDKSDLFFYDYSLAPLFVQENYLQVSPHCPKHEVLERFSLAADSISVGDLVDSRIRSQQAWGLLPTQAMYASVIPGHHLSGHVTGQIQFPSWLGKNSRGTKMQRLCQEIHAHTRLSTSGSKSSIFLDYAPHLRDAIVNPLLKDKADGIEKSLEVLESYHLLREDLESLLELSLWPGQRNPMILIDSKVKAAMTRTYNKSAAALPYAPQAVRRARAQLTHDHEDGLEGDDEVDDEQEDSDVENDALIKKKKVKEDKSSKDKPSTSKGKVKAGTSKERPSSSKSKKK